MPNQLTHEILCPRCKQPTARAVACDKIHTQGELTVTFAEEFMSCSNCGNEYFTNEQSKASSRAMTAAVRKAHGFLSGEEIKSLRESLHFTQAEFEHALGVGKKTVGRWERGTVPPTAAANFALWVASQHPAVFQEWARRGNRAAQTVKRFTMTLSASSGHAQFSQAKNRARRCVFTTVGKREQLEPQMSVQA
jgi:HTH-type transcriptional regulator / antitoxin MqsA